MPYEAVLKQLLLWPESIAEESWCAAARPFFEQAQPKNKQVIAGFDTAMTLVAAGYGIAIAPAARLVDYRPRGVTQRSLANTAPVVMTYWLCPPTLTDCQARFAKRVHKAFADSTNADDAPPQFPSTALSGHRKRRS